MSSNRGGNHGYMVGIDVEKTYLDFSKKHRIYHNLVLGDARYLPFREDCFDIVLASEIVEHIPKVGGLKLIGELERVCKGKVIITCPQGYTPKEAVKGREGDSHKASWTSSDLKKKGYKVHGIGFRLFKLYLGVKTSLRLYGALFYIFTPFSYVFPTLAEYLIAIKKIKQG